MSANGYVRSEGCAAWVLEKAIETEAGVVLSGIGTNQDGEEPDHSLVC